MSETILPPKNTFLNLEPEKRARITREAVEEFARHGYQQASLNTIVKRSGIAKGSLYQYFANKEALFFFVFEQFTNEVKQALQLGALGQADDFFEQVRQALWTGLGFIDQYPAYYEIYLKVLFEQEVPHRERLISRVRLFSAEFFGPRIEQAQRAGQIRPDVEVAMVVFLLDATLDRFLQGYARPYLDGGLKLAGLGRGDLEKGVETLISVLRDGLAAKCGRRVEQLNN